MSRIYKNATKIIYKKTQYRFIIKSCIIPKYKKRSELYVETYEKSKYVLFACPVYFY